MNNEQLEKLTKSQILDEINILKKSTQKYLKVYETLTGKPFSPHYIWDRYGTVSLDVDLKMYQKKHHFTNTYHAFLDGNNIIKKAVAEIEASIIKHSNVEDYQPINMDEYLEEKSARDLVAEIQVKHGRYEVQDVQKYNNTTAAIFLGVQEINTKLSGWDGRKDGKIPFEQKCNGLMSSYNLNGIYQDTSDNKLNRLSSGGLACNTAYIANGWIAYMVVYNTKMIVDILKNNRNNARKSGVISLNQVLDAGGKIVACQYSVKDTYADIIRHYPRLKHYLSEEDIHPASESKKIADEMAYWVEPTPLW